MPERRGNVNRPWIPVSVDSHSAEEGMSKNDHALAIDVAHRAGTRVDMN